LLAFDGRHSNRRAQRGLRNVDLHVQQDVVFAPLEIFVRVDPHVDVQVAVWPAIHTRVAFAHDANAALVWHSTGNIDAARVLLPNLSPAPAFLARCIDNFAPALAANTRRRFNNTAQERRTRLPDLARAVAVWAATWGRARFSAGAAAMFAGLHARELDLFFYAEHGFLKGQEHVVAEIAALAGTCARRAAAP